MTKSKYFIGFLAITIVWPIFALMQPVSAASAPSLVAPANDAVLTTYPRTATFKWTSVTSAVKYQLELACDVCVSATNKWQGARYITVFGTTYTGRVYGGDNQFRWRVRAIYSNGSYGPWSGYRYFKFKTGGSSDNGDSVVSSKPTLTSPSNGATVNNTNVYFDWNNVSNASSYNWELQKWNGSVWQSMDSGSGVSQSYFSYYFGDTSLNQYRFRVKARLSSGNYSDWSSWRYFYQYHGENNNYSAPTVNAPYANQYFTYRDISIRWSAVSDAVSYEVEVGYKLNGNWTYQNIYTAYQNPYTLTFYNDNDYRLRVRARFSNGSYTNWSDWRYFTVDADNSNNGNYNAGAPTISLPGEGATVYGPTLSINWYSQSNVSHYEVNLEYESNSNWYTEGNYTVYTNSYSKNVSYTNDYRVRVRTMYNDGSYSNWSSWRYFHYEYSQSSSLYAPTLYSPADESETTSNYIYLNWSDVSNADYYEYTVTKLSGSNWYYVTGGTVSVSQVYIYLTSGDYGQYSFRVRAVDNGVYGNWSAYNQFDYVYSSGSSTSTLSITSPAQNAYISNNTHNVYMTWNGLNNVYNYQIEVGRDNNNLATYSTAYSYLNYFASLNDSWYQFRVRGVLSNGNYTDWTSWRYFQYHYSGSGSENASKPIITYPTVNQVLSNNAASFIWTASNNANSYEVNFQYLNNGSWYDESTVSASTNNYARSFVNDNTYRVKVRAKFSDNTYTDWSDWVQFQIQ